MSFRPALFLTRRGIDRSVVDTIRMPSGHAATNAASGKGAALLLSVALTLAVTSARAAFMPPAYAGLPHSTSSTWDYAGNWSGGDSASHLTSFTSVGGTYPLTTQDLGCGPGVPCLNNDNTTGDADHLTFYLPNFVDPLQVKLLRVQFRFVRVDSPNFPDPTVEDVVGFDQGAFPPGALQSSSYVTDTFMTNGVFYTYGTFDFIIRPNPDYERLTITPAQRSELDQVRIDTISIPEPATALLAGAVVAALALLRRRHDARRQHAAASVDGAGAQRSLNASPALSIGRSR